MVIYKHEYNESKREIKIVEVEVEKKNSTYFVNEKRKFSCGPIRVYDKDFDVLKKDIVPIMLSLTPNKPLFLSLLLDQNGKQIKETEEILEGKKRSRIFLLSEITKEKRKEEGEETA